MAFNPQDFASPYITVDEVIEIKKAFDLFDRDLGGAIDPRGTYQPIKSLKLLLTPSVLRPRPKQSTKWLPRLTRMAVDRSISLSSSQWWSPDPLTMKPERKSTRSSSPMISKKQVLPSLCRVHRLERPQKGCQGPRRTHRWYYPPRNDRTRWCWRRWCSLWGRILQPHYQKDPLISI